MPSSNITPMLSTCSSPNHEAKPNSQIPTTPPLKLIRGIPFSWEKLPGIPKHQIIPNKNQSSSDPLLPPPPPPPKLLRQEEKHTRVQRDPFFAALVACSEDDRHRRRHHDDGNSFIASIWRGGGGGSKITRSLSDRFGFISMSAAVSCKSTPAVSESVVYQRRHPTPHYLVHRRPT